VAVALTSSRSVNKTKEDYFYKNLKTFKQWEWTKRRYRKNKQKVNVQEMAPIRLKKKMEINIPQHHVSSTETPVSFTNYRAMKF
jgi:hypothetical protein